MPQEQNRVKASIIIIEVLLLFIVGILGNKISETFEISTTALLIVTVLTLAILSGVSYARFGDFSQVNSEQRPSARRLLPKSIIGMIPAGVVLGAVVGLIVTSIDLVGSRYYPPRWMCAVIDSCNLYLSLSFDELVGVIIGLVVLVSFALLIDGPLGGALAFGYAVAFPTAMVINSNALHDTHLTYLGHILFFGAIGLILVLGEPVLRYVREAITQQRL